MTFEEFDNTGWTGQMKAKYKSKIYDIASCDFEERTIGLLLNIDGADKDSISWVRCEACEIIDN